MQLPRLQVEKHALSDVQALKITKRPGSSHYDRVLTGPVALEHNGATELVALPADEDYPRLLAALRRIKYENDSRTSGLISRSRTFGYNPRIVIRRDFCTGARLHRENPRETRVIFRWAQRAGAHLKTFLPEKHAAQVGMVERVLPAWRIPGTIFTSGIINQDNPLGFHHDAGNFKGAWSCMYAFQRDVAGGLLVIPEFRVAFSCARPTLIMFDGARLVHGVTDIRKMSRRAYRYSIVFYALAAMCKCQSPAEELERIRKLKTEREFARTDPEEVSRRQKRRQ